MTTEQPSVTQQFDAPSGKSFLQGREAANADQANVFGDEDFAPLGTNKRALCFEVVVQYCFFEGTVDDYAEVHRFWGKVWHQTASGPQAELIIDGEDFCAYQEED